VLTVKVERSPASPQLVLVTIISDPAGLVAGASGRYRTATGNDNVVNASGRDRIELALPPSSEVVVWARDRHGNRLVEEHLPALPDVEAPVIDTTSSAPPSRLRHPLPWTLVAAGFAVTGGVFAVLARSTRDELEGLIASGAQHDYADAQVLDDEGRRRTLFANVAFAVAGVSAIVAGVMYVTYPQRRVAMTTAIGGDGAAVGIAGHF
jgi:hypothetical protein